MALPATIEVGEEVARHLAVLRLQPGSDISLFDGGGGEFAARIGVIGKRSASVDLRVYIDLTLCRAVVGCESGVIAERQERRWRWQ